MIGHGSLLVPAAAVSLVVRSTVLIVGAGLAAQAMQAAGRSAASRHLIWLTTFGALLLLPLLWALLPALRIPGFPTLGGSAARAVRSGSVQGALGVSPAWMHAVLVAYSSGVILHLIRICTARWVLAKMWRAAVPCGGEGWAHILADAQKRMAVTTTVALRCARSNGTPMTWGTISPRILLPADARTWGREQRRMVLMHELAHVSRFDSAARLTASLACTIHWIHPGVWFAARRMRAEQEQAADELVLSAGAAPLKYARTLLELASRKDLAGAGVHAVAMAGPRSELEARLVSIVGAGPRQLPSRCFAATLVALAAGATLLVAITTPVRAQLTTEALHSPPPVPPLPAVTPIPAIPATPPTPAHVPTPVVPPSSLRRRP